MMRKLFVILILVFTCAGGVLPGRRAGCWESGGGPTLRGGGGWLPFPATPALKPPGTAPAKPPFPARPF